MSISNQTVENSSPTSVSYEFTDSENRIFKRLANQIILNSFLFMIGGILFYILAISKMGANEITQAMSYFLDGILQFAIGISIIRSYDNFNRITKTQGSDIPELLQGLRDLDVSFKLATFLIIVIIIVEYLFGML